SNSFNILILAPLRWPSSKQKEQSRFHSPYTLPSSVSCNSFVCHSYENCRGVYQQFPERNRPAPFTTERNSHELANRNNHSYSEFCPAPLPAPHSQRAPLPPGRL